MLSLLISLIHEHGILLYFVNFVLHVLRAENVSLRGLDEFL